MLTREDINFAEKNLDLVLVPREKAYSPSQAVKMFLAGEDGVGTKISRPTQPYAQIDVVFACVEKIINSVVGMPLVLSTDDERIIESGPIYDFLYNNPALTFEDFLTQTVGHWALTRDVFWIFPDGTKELYVVSGLQMRAVTHNNRPDGQLVGWQFGYGAGIQNFGLGEVHQLKNFSPYDKHHGIGPMRACSLAMSQSYQAALFNESSLANGAEPGLILTTTGNPTAEEVQMLRSQFDSRHKGAGNAKRTALLTGGMTADTVAMNMVDLQIAELKESNDKRICSAFGVPPEVIGLATEAQYAQGPAQKDLISNTIVPLCQFTAGHITSGIMVRFYPSEHRGIELTKAKSIFGSRNITIKADWRIAKQKAVAKSQKMFAWFDTSAHPVVQEMQREVADKVLSFREAGIPTNNLIDAYDLPFEKYAWNDHFWIGMGQVPASYVLEAGTEGLTGPSAPEEPNKEEDKHPTDYREKTTEKQK